jgi:hypothetical protein
VYKYSQRGEVALCVMGTCDAKEASQTPPQQWSSSLKPVAECSVSRISLTPQCLDRDIGCRLLTQFFGHFWRILHFSGNSFPTGLEKSKY